ncbi:lysophospholipase [Pichia kluyveri]|uniref:Lysophospholipase n=1 Tax=Pichia kluyveri TaxID=36015 RepID=A0AAV5R1Z9_PICKL|nr:lysophospholipase [Pichia kluyveri]
MLAHFAATLILTSIVNAWSPTDSYAPGIVDCPSYLDEDDYNTDNRTGFLRRANGISDLEEKWMQERDNITIEHLKEFLRDTNLKNTDSYLDDIVSNSSARIPRIALSFSGGGYRAMLCAAGEIAGLDNRTVGTDSHGLPILEAASYISGLSGGSWFVSSLVYNNWTSVQEIIDQTGDDDAIWDLDHNILAPHGINIVKDASYWDDLDDQISQKRDAGFEVSMTDPWGRGLSYQFFPGLDDKGASMTFSGLQDWEIFKNHSIPFPIVVSDGRTPGNKIINGNSTVFEFNPFELGSYDGYVDTFVDLKYVGTPMDEGKPSGNGSCWAGLDNTGFVFGTSSTLFNQFLLQLNTTDLSGLAYTAANHLLQDLSKDENDIAPWHPNPFFNSPWGSSEHIISNDTLFLVDGGEDSQNVPLYPLLQESRGVDVIFAFDNSADTDENWPNGASLVSTYERQFNSHSANVSFPYVPTIDTFLHNNLTAKPTFFGCYASNLTSLMEETNTTYVPPLVIYIANRPWSFNSNTSTFKLSYDDDEKLSMIKNGFEISTFNNLTIDDNFSTCIGCAILQRSKERMGEPLGDECKSCFDEYCWDGSTYTYPENASQPNDFTTTGRYNNTQSQASADEEVNPDSSSTASASASSTAGNSISSISSKSHNDANINGVSPLFTVLALALSVLALN